MSPEEAAFHAAIDAAPVVHMLPRLVFADWLDEQGRGGLAEGYRMVAHYNRAPWTIIQHGEHSGFMWANYLPPSHDPEMLVGLFGVDQDLSFLPTCWVLAMETKALSKWKDGDANSKFARPSEAFLAIAEAWERMTVDEKQSAAQFFVDL